MISDVVRHKKKEKKKCNVRYLKCSYQTRIIYLWGRHLEMKYLLSVSSCMWFELIEIELAHA